MAFAGLHLEMVGRGRLNNTLAWSCVLNCRRRYVKGKKPSSTRWLERQHKDMFVKLAVKNHYRSRSAYKLIQINEKFHLLKKNMTVIDLGAAPGAWSQVVAEVINPDGSTESSRVIAVDVKDIEPIRGVTVVANSDILQADTPKRVKATLAPLKHADVILSDMSPSASGNHSLDHYRIMELARAAFDLSLLLLPPQSGAFVCKVLEGTEKREFVGLLRRNFQTVKEYSPAASRQNSTELYIIAWN